MYLLQQHKHNEQPHQAIQQQRINLGREVEPQNPLSILVGRAVGCVLHQLVVFHRDHAGFAADVEDRGSGGRIGAEGHAVIVKVRTWMEFVDAGGDRVCPDLETDL